MSRGRHLTKTAVHRPAARRRRFKYDNPRAGDLFSGFGGLTEGIKRAGFDTIVAANHDEYKVEIHEANHPEVEHWIADLVDTDAPNYHSVRDLPPVELLVAGVSCVNHSTANSQRAYENPQMSLLEMDDPEYDNRVTRSEKDRATANCVLHYAATHHPMMILIECTTQLQSWGKLVAGSKKIGDGSTYRWWLKQFGILGYKHKVLFLNTQFFGVGQCRDRGFWVLWDEKLPSPDLEFRPPSWCMKCETVVEAAFTWRTGIPPTGKVAWGQQYHYTCPSCRTIVIPPMTPSITAIDLTDLGTRIGDKPIKKFYKNGELVGEGPMAPATMARALRCKNKFAEFPAVLMPAKSMRGSERHPWQPMATQTSQHETTLLSTGAVMAAAGNTYETPGSDCRIRGLDQPLWAQTATNGLGVMTPPVALAVDNYQGAPRGADEPLPTQLGSETMALLSGAVFAAHRHNGKNINQPMDTATATHEKAVLLASGVIPYRKHTQPTTHAEAMPTITADQIPGLLTAAGRVQCNGSIEEAKYRAHALDKPLGAVTASSVNQGLLFSGWYKQNGSNGTETAPHPVTDPFNSFTSRDTTALLSAEWLHALSELTLDDCWFRMMRAYEIGRGCGFDVDFVDYKGTFKVWGSDRDQVDGYGNSVTPQIGHFIGGRLRPILSDSAAIA